MYKVVWDFDEQIYRVYHKIIPTIYPVIDTGTRQYCKDVADELNSNLTSEDIN